MVALVDDEATQESCAQNGRKKRNTEPAYINRQLLIQIIQENAEYMEEVIQKIKPNIVDSFIRLLSDACGLNVSVSIT